MKKVKLYKFGVIVSLVETIFKSLGHEQS